MAGKARSDIQERARLTFDSEIERQILCSSHALEGTQNRDGSLNQKDLGLK
jgi:hypothetical protein